MSFHRFLASEVKLDEYDNTGKEIISYAEAQKRGHSFNEEWIDLSKKATVMVFEDEESLYNLQVINRDNSTFEHKYTDKKHISEVAMKYDDERINELLSYIRSQIAVENEMELWVLLLDQDTNVSKETITIDKLNADVLKRYYEYDFGLYPRCLTITNK
jgi:hypothetical protein